MNQYRFDPDSLQYEKVEKDLRSRLMKVLTGISSLVLGVLIIVLYSVLFDTPRERELRQENEALHEDYLYLSRKYAQIDTVLRELKDIDKNIYRTIFGTEPLLDSFNYGPGMEDYLSLINTNNEKIITHTRKGLDNALGSARLNKSEYNFLLGNINGKEELLQSLPGIQPVKNPDLTLLASGYGNRLHPFYKIVKFHYGIDFTVSTGTEVFATGDGTVIETRRSGRGQGNTLIIDHGYGYQTLYAHLDRFEVRNGNQVKRGDLIARVGNSGLSVAPHLHYEVLLNGRQVNPINYFFLELSPDQYYRLIDISLKSGQSFD